jgi:hypothetical protein
MKKSDEASSPRSHRGRRRQHGRVGRRGCRCGSMSCRGATTYWGGTVHREGTVVVSERETGEVAGLCRSEKRKSRQCGDGGTTGDEAASV